MRIIGLGWWVCGDFSFFVQNICKSFTLLLITETKDGGGIEKKAKNLVGKRKLDRKEEKVFLLAAYLDSLISLFPLLPSSLVFSFVFSAWLFHGDLGGCVVRFVVWLCDVLPKCLFLLFLHFLLFSCSFLL